MERVDGGHLQWIRPNVFPITHTVIGKKGHIDLECAQMLLMHCVTLQSGKQNHNWTSMYIS